MCHSVTSSRVVFFANSPNIITVKASEVRLFNSPTCFTHFYKRTPYKYLLLRLIQQCRSEDWCKGRQSAECGNVP